jgi:hypothetical protein
MYCYDFSLVLSARSFLNMIWTQGKKLKLWEVYDFEREENGTLGVVVGYELQESGLDSWIGKEFAWLPEGPY